MIKKRKNPFNLHAVYVIIISIFKNPYKRKERIMKKILIMTIALITAVTCCFMAVACVDNFDYEAQKAEYAAKTSYSVGVIQLAPHDALDKANNAFCEELEKLIKEAGKTVTFTKSNAQGEDANNSSIIDNFIAKKVDLIYSIATASSQTAVSKAKDYHIPVIFNAVTDPVDAKLVDKLEGQSGNVTGVSDINPIAQQVDLMVELMGGDTKDLTIGVLFVSKETNSVVQKDAVKSACKEKGIAFVEEAIDGVDNIGNALNSLKNKGADIVYLPTDNVLAANAATVHAKNVSDGINLPIVCGEGGMTELCGVATLSVDYSYLGKLAAQQAFEILMGQKSAMEIPVASQTENFTYIVNTEVANAIGFTIPQSVIDKAE